MQQFIPFNDQWDDLTALVPYQAEPARPVAAPAPTSAALCGTRYNEEDLFAGWP